MAILLTDSRAEDGVGGEVDGVDPLRNPGKYPAAWVSKNYKGAFVHELGHLFGARIALHYHIKLRIPQQKLFIIISHRKRAKQK